VCNITINDSVNIVVDTIRQTCLICVRHDISVMQVANSSIGIGLSKTLNNEKSSSAKQNCLNRLSFGTVNAYNRFGKMSKDGYIYPRYT